ncbi:AraC family transcriptional regulator [Paraburkholderia solisilvae]|uniref:DNA gyrase inhibitor n=1 Tax=Paraburkholderia solisilvae TaxID=624376 RepID=A0A6J5EFY4_9BURK|nr:AraC family transcriptional regulator [Paraburkholderia solisilvae]CAB3764271.1 DNA gyrase inhibitor [Paraburkholderia solisilvae]
MNDLSHRSRYLARLQRVLDYIYDHLDEPLDIDRLARIACLSPYHWHRIYQGLYGETIATTVRRLRLHRAAGLLANGTQPIADIAALSGYSSLQSFTRTFRAVYGTPPARYRKEGSHRRFRPAISGDAEMEHRDVEIRDVPAMEVVSIAHVGDYMQIGKAFDALEAWLAARNLLSADMRMIGIYYDDPGVVEKAQLRAKAGVLLPRRVDVAAPFDMTPVRGGRYAVLRHKGPYADMHAAYEWLFGEWLVKSGHEPADAPVFEEYLNDPKHTAPAELLTEIYVPLAQHVAT